MTGTHTKPRTREPMSALNRVPLRESGEPLVDARHHCPGVRVSRRCLPLLRETVAEMLARAQASLPAGYRLWLRTALRTMEMQRAHYDSYFAQVRLAHPDWTYATLRRATNRYFAPVDQKAPPGHCTGGAADVWLLKPGGRVADTFSPFTDWEGAATFREGLTAEARRCRTLLYETMVGAGFSNCADEFWHYSYGDAAWAVRTGAPYCLYGPVLPPESYLGCPSRA